MGRSLLFVLLAMVVLFGSERLGVTQPLVIPLLLIGGLVGTRLLQRRRAMTAAAEPVDGDETVLRTGEACRRAGLSHLRVRVVRGDVVPYINLTGEVLQITSVTASLWTDDELTSMIRSLAATPRRYAWRLNAEMYWPWGYVAVLFVPLLPFAGLLPLLPILLCVVAQGWRSTSGRPLTPRLTRAHFGAYLAQGGDGPTYLSACAKLLQASMRVTSRQALRDHLALGAWANLRLMAGMCGVGEDDLKMIIWQATGSPEIYESAFISRWRRMRPYRPFMIGAAVIFAFVAMMVWAGAQLMTSAAG